MEYVEDTGYVMAGPGSAHVEEVRERRTALERIHEWTVGELRLARDPGEAKPGADHIGC